MFSRKGVRLSERTRTRSVLDETVGLSVMSERMVVSE